MSNMKVAIIEIKPCQSKECLKEIKLYLKKDVINSLKNIIHGKFN